MARSHLLPLLFTLVLGVAVAADTMAEELLGAPSYNHLTETTYRQVSWEDFKGNGVSPPGWNRWQKSSYAHIATKLHLGTFDIEERQDGEAWIAVPVKLRPYAIMNKDFSAVKHGSRNDYALAHEQLHFDIAELVARRVAVRLLQLEGHGETQWEAREDLEIEIDRTFAAGVQELDELQEQYDGETVHGQKKKLQKKWASRVKQMFDEATAALVAALQEP